MPVSKEAGDLARELLSTDAAWCLDIYNSARATPNGVHFAPWMMLSVSARVAFEGRRVIQHSDPNVGVPRIVPYLAENESPSVEMARHAAKLLDNTKKSVEDFRVEMQNYWTAHHKWMRGRAPRFLHGLVKELGVATFDEHVVLATIPTQMRFALPTGPPDELRDAALKLGEDLGRDLSAFHLMVGTEQELPASLDLRDLEDVTWEDHYVRKFLPVQYESTLDDEAKLLLLLLESDLNTLVFMLARTARGNSLAFFRNAMITVWHSLVSLQSLLAMYPAAAAPGVRSLLGTQDVRDFLDPKNKRIRNVFMHYVPQDLAFDRSRPMSGLVEAMHPSHDAQSLAALTESLALRLQRAVEEWRLGA